LVKKKEKGDGDDNDGGSESNGERVREYVRKKDRERRKSATKEEREFAHVWLESEHAQVC